MDVNKINTCKHSFSTKPLFNNIRINGMLYETSYHKEHLQNSTVFNSRLHWKELRLCDESLFRLHLLLRRDLRGHQQCSPLLVPV